MKIKLKEDIYTALIRVPRGTVLDVIKEMGDYLYLDKKDSAAFMPFYCHKKYCEINPAPSNKVLDKGRAVK